uniref:Macaca fascicularis brain cDNA clone: QmoA-10984, similar to human bone morphogenetic protein receptor, type II(serine/threonine kinase) (BMPR2), transcript variant 2, mRNA, RefSeq: NM_033346.2 n=1 Tax=Macaca fascicularis TaxID=9541 RepID=I7GH72_MACFA|nr:unnamed protein product [Macaca fascicularis]
MWVLSILFRTFRFHETSSCFRFILQTYYLKTQGPFLPFVH